MKLINNYNNIFIIFLLLLSTISSFAQQKKIALLDNNKKIGTTLLPFLKKGEVVHFQKSKAADLLAVNDKEIEFSFQFENKEWVLRLEQNDILSKSFFVTTGSEPKQKFNYENECAHYKGFVKGKPNSFAAVSILADKIVAVISDDSGNINIGAINTNEARQTNEHIIYRDADLRIANEFQCNTVDATNANTNPIPTYSAVASTTSTTINPEPVDIYFEADYQTYLNNSSNVTNVVNYVTALFNVVNVLYDNDSVNTKISAIKVWNVADPYVGLSTTSAVLNAFAANMTNGFPGDLAHFLSQRGIGGGIAYINVLCASDYYKTGVSGNLSNSFNTFPTYSWSAMVITHELGHNLGSPHTQSCTWPGGAIDNCYATEGGCAAGPAPTNGGTIMSYCHLTGYGINLANGFGPLPGAKIRSYVRNNTCINPGVYFETTYQSVNEEQADMPNGCLPYKLITTKLKIPYAPTQPVDVTLVPTGSTGLIIGTNADVELSPLTFTLDGNNLFKTINMKVYNDAIIENNETLTLNFNINANGGNAIKKNTGTTFTLNIVSEDHKPDSSINQLLFYESFDGITTGLGSWTQNIVYGNTSPNRWIVANNAGADFISKAAYISNDGNTASYSSTSLNDSTIIRLESPSINANGFTNMHLSFLVKVLGELALTGGGSQGGTIVYNDYGRVLYSINNGNTWLIARDNLTNFSTKSFLDISLPVSTDNAANLKVAFEWRNNSSIVNNPPLIVDSIVIRGTSTCAIQTAAHVNNMDDENLGPNQIVHYYNPITKNIMATIENNSSFDFGCTKVELIRTGTAALQAWGVLASDKVSSKAYKITSTNTSPSAEYKLKLYYTDAEINGWLATTGNNISDAQIVKTNADVTTLSPSLPPIFSSLNSRNSFGGTTHTVISSIITGNSATSTYAIMKPYGSVDCPSNVLTYTTNIVGTNYQWQVNIGAGYVNISNDAVYNNVATNTLQLTAAPSIFLGNKYRCKITTGAGVVYSQEYVLKFVMTWLGTVNNAWETPQNWSCNQVPNDKTDVIINEGTAFTPEVNMSTTIRSLTTTPNINLKVKTGVVLTVNH